MLSLGSVDMLAAGCTLGFTYLSSRNIPIQFGALVLGFVDMLAAGWAIVPENQGKFARLIEMMKQAPTLKSGVPMHTKIISLNLEDTLGYPAQPGFICLSVCPSVHNARLRRNERKCDVAFVACMQV